MSGADPTRGTGRGLQGFVDALRRQGIPVSRADSVAAERMLDALDPDDRLAVRSALRGTLAKNVGDRTTFDLAFDKFFPLPEPVDERAPEPADPRRPKRRTRGPRRHGLQRPRTLHSAERRDPRPARSTVPSSTGELRDRVRHKAEAQHRRAPRFIRARAARKRDVPGWIEAGTGADALPRTPLKATSDRPISREEDVALRAAVSGLLRQLPPSAVRRSVGTPLPDAGSFPGAPRRRLRWGTAPLPPAEPFRRFELTPVLVVDVSHSVRRSAGLFLQLAAPLLRRSGRARVLLLVDRVYDATAAVRSWLQTESGEAAPDVTRFLRALDPGTAVRMEGIADYGAAFQTLLHDHAEVLQPDTALLIHGDARAGVNDAAPWAFEECARRSGHTAWIVPEPEDAWGTGDSALEAYLPWCELIFEARELFDLGVAVSTLLDACTHGRVRG